MRLRHLRYFAAVAEAQHMSRAAAKLRIAQPALSRQIRELETELGVQLLDRHPRGVSPTPAGEALARGSVRLITDIAAAIDRAEGAATGRTGRIIIGVPHAPLARGFAGMLERTFRATHPEITLTVRAIDGLDAWAQVESGELDLALGTLMSATPAIAAEHLWDEVACRALIAANHPLASRERISLSELAYMPALVSSRGTPASLVKVLLAALGAAGFRSPILAPETGLAGSRIMVAAGRGWTLITESLRAVLPPGTAAPLLDGVNIPVGVAIGWRHDERRAGIRTLIECVYAFARTTTDSRIRETPDLPHAPARRSGRIRKPGTTPVELDLRHLVALLEVASAQSIGRAAERLGVTQSALSRQLQELEDAVGYKLLDRGARGVSLTAGGTALASECPALLSDVERLTRETTRARRGMHGHCLIGAISTASASELLGAVLTHCAEHHPNIHVVIDEISTPTQLDALRHGKIDVGLMHGSAEFSGDAIAREVAHSDIVDYALLPESHPLASKREVTASDLAPVPFLWMSRAYHLHIFDRVFDGMASIGLNPRVDSTYDSHATILVGVAQNLGWCLASRSTAAHPPPGTTAVRIKDLHIEWQLHMTWRTDERSPAVRAVLAAFRAARDGATGARKSGPQKRKRK